MASLKKENGHVTEVVSNGGRMDVTEVVTNGGGMVMLQQWSLMEGEWLSYGGCQFNGGRMVMLQKWSL